MTTMTTLEQAINAAHVHMRTFIGTGAQKWDGTWLNGMCIYQAQGGGFVIGAEKKPAEALRIVGFADKTDYYPIRDRDCAIRMIEGGD